MAAWVVVIMRATAWRDHAYSACCARDGLRPALAAVAAGEEHPYCQALIEAHKACLRTEGFKVCTDPLSMRLIEQPCSAACGRQSAASILLAGCSLCIAVMATSIGAVLP